MERSENYEKEIGDYIVHTCDDVGCAIRRRSGSFDRWKEVANMEVLGNLMSVLDYVLDTKRKRHITGGILLSISALFGGLALTAMTIRNEEDDDE